MSTPDVADESPPVGRRGGWLGRSFLTTMSTSAATIVLGLVSGVLTARFLGSDGRGVVAAVSSWTLTLTWASNLGFANAMVYFQSRGADRDRVLATTLMAVPVLGAIAVGVAQILVPFGFAAQSEETRAIARLFLCAIPIVLATEEMWAMLMARHRFAFLGLVRTVQPAAYVVTLIALLGLDRFSPVTVLSAQMASYVLALVIALVGLVSEGIARPDWSLARRALGYGLRLQGVQLAALRLDLLLLPAVVGAAQVGFYSIALNISSMVVTLFGSVAMVVFPVAATGDLAGARRALEGGLRLTFIGGGATVLAIAATAPWVVPFVYGAEFGASVTPLWLMLPGILLCAANVTLTAGLQGEGRPGRASLIQLTGMVVLVVGFFLTVPDHGIAAAAVMSSVSYAFVFLLTHRHLARDDRVSLRRALAPSNVRADGGRLLDVLRARVSGGG